ncbi:DUF6270 domain-containing protein [Terribacillus aidingensis]|uniref:DUF6270 domain-containing protein n=1 Tax=Terribacillus aidingensis TaxID=586416 RepID=UPI00345073C2
MTIKIASYGSCITRDNFNSKLNKNYKERYECVATSLHASLISLFSREFSYDETKIDYIDEENVHNEADKRKTIEELSKSFFHDLKVKQPDYLIMDFYTDVFLGVFFTQDRFVTNNGYISKTSFFNELPEKFHLKIDRSPSDYFGLLLPSIAKFMDFLKKEVPNCEVIINKGRFSNRLLDSEGKVSYLPSLQHYNDIWDKLDNYMISKYDLKFIELDHEQYYISPKPTIGWDVFQLHYHDNYYHDFLEQLNTVTQIDKNAEVN